MTPETRIVKILEVNDTREYELVGTDKGYDKAEPVLGSGDEIPCARCGRTIVVHARVLLDNGQESVVGTGCMKAEFAEIGIKIASLDSCAKRIARLERELAGEEANEAAWDKVKAEVDALPVPDVVFGELDRTTYSAGRGKISCGDSYAMFCDYDLRDASRKEERVRVAIEGWKENRMVERGQRRYRPTGAEYIREDLRKALVRMEKLKEVN